MGMSGQFSIFTFLFNNVVRNVDGATSTIIGCDTDSCCITQFPLLRNRMDAVALNAVQCSIKYKPKQRTR